MKKFAIGCGVLALLFALLILGLRLAWPKISTNAKGWVQRQMDESAKKTKFEAEWKPPTPQPDDHWFPLEFDGWKRYTAGPIKELPELNLTREGYSATYILNGQRADLEVVAVSELETEALMGRAHGYKPLPDNSHSSSSVQWGKTLEMKFGETERILCRPFKGWFLFLHTVDGADLGPFTEAWLHAIDQAPAAATPAPEPAH